MDHPDELMATLAVGISAMPHTYNIDYSGVIIDLIDDTILAKTDPKRPGA